MFKACNSHLHVCEQGTGLFGTLRARKPCITRLASVTLVGQETSKGVDIIIGSLLKMLYYQYVSNLD